MKGVLAVKENVRILYAEKSLIVAPTELTYLPSPSLREYDYYAIMSLSIGENRIQLPLLLESVSKIHEFGRKAALDRRIPVSHLMLAFSGDRLLEDNLPSILKGSDKVLIPISWVAPYIFTPPKSEEVARELEALSDVSMLFRFFAYQAWLKLNEAMQVFSPFTYISRVVEPLYTELAVARNDADLWQEFDDDASRFILEASLKLLKWRIETELLAMRGCSKAESAEKYIEAYVEDLRCSFGRHKSIIERFSKSYAEFLSRIFLGQSNKYIIFVVFLPQLSHVIHSLRTLNLISTCGGQVTVKLLHPHLLNPLIPIIYVLEQLAKVAQDKLREKHIAILVVYDYPFHDNDARIVSDVLIKQLTRFIQSYLYCYSRRRLGAECECRQPSMYTWKGSIRESQSLNVNGYVIHCSDVRLQVVIIRAEKSISRLHFESFVSKLPFILDAREDINAVIATSYVDIPKDLLYSILRTADLLRQQRTLSDRESRYNVHVERLVHLQAWEQVAYAGNLLGLRPPGSPETQDSIVTGVPIYIYRIECDHCKHYQFNQLRDNSIRKQYRLLFGKYYELTASLFTFDNLNVIVDKMYIPVIEY